MRGSLCTAASLVALLTVGVSPALALSLSLSSNYDHPAAKVRVSGSGFGANTAIDIYFDTTDELVVTADANGKFSKHSIQVPASALPGEHWVSAVERDNGLGAQKSFTVTTDWTELGFDSRNRRNNPWENVISASNVATLDTMWSRKTGGVIVSSPAVVNGLAYVTSQDDSLYAFDIATGSQLWTFAASTPILSSPAVAGGTVYFASVNQGFTSGQIYAVDAASGALKWSAEMGDTVASPAVLNGAVYICNTAGTVFAFDAATGTQLWGQNVFGDIYASPAVVDGSVYVATDRNVSALDAATGTILWQIAANNANNSTPLVSGGNVWILSSSQGNPYFLERIRAADGSIVTNMNLGGTAGVDNTPVNPAPAMANGIAYVSIGGSGQVVALKPNGQNLNTLWTANLDAGGIPTTPAVGNGVVYVASGSNGDFFAIDAGTGNTLWSGFTDGVLNDSSPAISNGAVFIGGDKRLFAFALNGGENAVYKHKHTLPPSFAALHPNFHLKPSR